tara:strand:+ start:629 stop:1540 length:912 start_codon:yes stop_codon:yes gene_type:complete
MRVSIFFGTLFLFFNCSSQIPSSWVLRDIQSLDVKIMNTKQWLKTEKSNYKYLNKVMRSELSFYRKNDFRVFQDLNREMELINKCLEKVKSSLSKQMKLATKIKKRPSLGIFDGKQSQQKKNSLFSKKKNNLSIVNKSDKAIKVIKSLEKNSISILESQSDYNSSIESLTAALKKKRSRLVFIRKQVIQWNQQLKELIHVREKLVPTIDNFNLILSEALFKSAESSYAKNIIDLSKLIEKYNDEMDSFESYVNNIESIAGKQVKGLVYIIKDTEEKNYEKKYKKGLTNYQNILKEIPKLINSV